MDRHALDDFTRQHRLAPPAAAAALQLTGLRPSAPAWRTFAAALLHAAGIGAVGAGLLFFVAANWQDYGVLGRFVLLQCALLGCVAVALWRPPPSAPGQAALVLATLLTGGLLALFGQSYQTGADLYELFFTWARLALPFALAGLSAPLWAVWWSVFNVGLALLCGWLGMDHFIWRMIEGPGVDRPVLLMAPCMLNLLAAGGYLLLGRSRFSAAAPLWLPRYLACLGILYGTAAVLAVVTGAFRDADSTSGMRAAVVVLFIGLSIGIAVGTWLKKRDVFPMALIAASWIAISTTWLVESMRFDDVGSMFVVALWLIAASTATGMLLMHWVRNWGAAPALSKEVEA
jgi:uncharacterized membrane protein